SHFIMENKTVTKKILAEDGFSVPAGDEYQSIDNALASYGKYQNQGIVIKPKSTNYGIGITVFKKSVSKSNYEEALKIAFEKDDSALIEEFVEGYVYNVSRKNK
ncbi:MAG: bifunctional glutamate--cysteine ligase/glutathione synthetase, partial [Tetragenococcus koreensis]|nr:bifunctional glutamate--cysteine ligase/glutathione synthetase [Tetragenococcus koreensis]